MSKHLKQKNKKMKIENKIKLKYNYYNKIMANIAISNNNNNDVVYCIIFGIIIIFSSIILKMMDDISNLVCIKENSDNVNLVEISDRGRIISGILIVVSIISFLISFVNCCRSNNTIIHYTDRNNRNNENNENLISLQENNNDNSDMLP